MYHLDARQLLPVLLRRLVHSTGHDLRKVDFPGYDNAERKGSDGIVESNAPTAWIPDGKSFWEFGVNKSPQVKAEKNYAARVASVPAAERVQSTFVFVTPRNWPGKDCATNDTLERVADRSHVPRRSLLSPCPRGVPPYRLEIRTGDLRELEAPHRSAKKASIWSSLSSRITFPVAASS